MVDVRTQHKNIPDVIDKQILQIFGQVGNRTRPAASSDIMTELNGKKTMTLTEEAKKRKRVNLRLGLSRW